MREPPERGRFINVADFSTHVSGPTASFFLRAVGAKVVKIENPKHGDGNRRLPAVPVVRGEGIYHHALNAGTESVAVDPRHPAWPSWVEGFAKWADVVIVGGRAKDNERLGLTRGHIAKLNSEAIYCHISAYGSHGPWRDRAAHGQNPDALAGLVDVSEAADGTKVPVGWRSVGASFAGVVAAVGILGALVRRSERGEVTAVETSLWESAIWWNWRQLTAASNLDIDWGVIRDLGSRYALYTTRDGRPLQVAPVEQKFWEPFCDASGLSHLADTGDWSQHYYFGETEDDGPERQAIARKIREKTLDEWIDILEPIGVPFCEVLTAHEVIRTPHFSDMQMLQPVSNGGTAIRPPLTLVGGDSTANDRDGSQKDLPQLGSSTETYRTLLGIN